MADLIETKSRNLDRDFSIVETNFLNLSRFSRPSRLILFWRRDRDLDRDHVETNRDPQPYEERLRVKSKNNKSSIAWKERKKRFSRGHWNDWILIRFVKYDLQMIWNLEQFKKRLYWADSIASLPYTLHFSDGWLKRKINFPSVHSNS